MAFTRSIISRKFQWEALSDFAESGLRRGAPILPFTGGMASTSGMSIAPSFSFAGDQGGGALGAIGSHLFDYVVWLFAPVARLCGQLSTTIATRPDPLTGEAKPVDADDTCTLMLELTDGTPCQACLSAVTYQGRGHWVEVYGDRGTLVLGSDNQSDYVHGFKLWGSQAGQPLTELEIPARLAFPATYPDGRLAPFIRVVDQWVQGIEQGRPLAPSLQEGVYSQLLMDLTHQSHQTGTWVEVPPLNSILP
ncbi:hypothetical protein JVX88_24505 [Leptolyngbya sp. 7M]|nr:hypothetical protein JVX88_24505 [Leptolyngbya sp. 7M]